MMKTLTVSVDLQLEGDDNFIDLLGAVLGEKKSLVATNDLSIWEYDPATTVKKVTVAPVGDLREDTVKGY